MIKLIRTIFICQIVFFCVKTSKAQNDTFQSLRTYYAQKTASECAEYEILLKLSEKSPIWKYLPSLGIVSDFDGKPRPTLSFSLNKAYEVKNERERQKLTLNAKIEAVKRQNAIQFKNDSLNVIYARKTLVIAQNARKSLETQKPFEIKTLNMKKDLYDKKMLSDLEWNAAERVFYDFEQRERETDERCDLLKIALEKAEKRGN